MIIEPHTDDTGSAESNRSFTRVFNKKMSSKNPWDRIFALGKIHRILSCMQDEKLTAVGEKLIKGVYSKRMIDYAYLQKQNNHREELYSDSFASEGMTDPDIEANDSEMSH